MSLYRYLGQIRRKFKNYLLLFIVICCTASFVYFSRIQIEPGQRRSARSEFRYAAKNDRTPPPPAAPRKSQLKNVVYPEVHESRGEFDTFDIYKGEIARKPLEHLSNVTTNQRTKKTEKLKVFVLPFTHVDPGWLRTFDSYSEDTDKILTNMHSFMMANPRMRFMWAEFVFFERWWSKQSELVKKDVRGMVKNGQLELASGSWVMTDEANAYFPVSVDNIVEGQQFIQREFGIQSSVVWSNDPFGYSNTVPYLFREAGLKRTVINRIHHGIKGSLQSNKAIPFRWRQYFDSTGDSDVLTHVLPYSHYDIINSCGPEGGRCCEFDFKRITHWSCPGPKPVPITAENVKSKAATLVEQLQKMSSMYESPVLLMVHGDDFRFDMIEEWHQQHDNFLPVFDEINKGDEAEISFGTFTDYFNTMEKWYADKQIQPATLTGDFFPYKCALGDLWTGYFTTRPFYKRQGRLLHSMIRAGDLLSSAVSSAFSDSEQNEVRTNLEKSRRTLSLFQHHDAITGTSKKHVMKDYSELLFHAMNMSKSAIESSLKYTTGSSVTVSHFPTSFSETQTKVPLSMRDSKAIHVSIFNPLPYVVDDTVSIRIDSVGVTVRSKDTGETVSAQIEPFVFKGDVAQKTYLLTFAITLQPLATSYFEVVAEESSTSTKLVEVFTTSKFMAKMKDALPEIFTLVEITDDKFGLRTEKLRTEHDAATGMLKRVSSDDFGSHAVATSFMGYQGASGGAYLMRVRKEAEKYVSGDVPKILVKGPVQQSVHLFANNIYQRVTAKHVPGVFGEQLDLHIRIDIQKEHNLEVAMRVETDLVNAKFYADGVGMQLLRRESHDSLGVPDNYYPMPSAAVMETSQHRLTVSSNVEHGVMALGKHGMEIMIDRILNQDDGKGLGNGEDSIPTDLYPVDMQFSLLFEKANGKAAASDYMTVHSPSGHLSVQNILYPPIVAVGVEAARQPSLSLPPLPCDYQLLTVRPLSDGKRLMIVFRNGVAGQYGTPAGCGNDVDDAIRAYLLAIGAKSVQQTNLSGIETSSKELDAAKVKLNLEPFKFASYILNMN